MQGNNRSLMSNAAGADCERVSGPQQLQRAVGRVTNLQYMLTELANSIEGPRPTQAVDAKAPPTHDWSMSEAVLRTPDEINQSVDESHNQIDRIRQLLRL